MTVAAEQVAADDGPRHLLRFGPSALLLVAVSLWVAALLGVQRTALLGMGDLGLTPVLPWTFFAALLALLLGFPLLLRRGRYPVRLAGLYVLALTLVWHATPAILYGTPRYPFSYKHIGVAAYIQQHGDVNPLIDAYFNWPGFFALNALLGEAGRGLPLSLVATWAPVFMNLLIVLGLVVLLRSLDLRAEAVALSVWVYQLGSWVAQDYFAPQALALAQHLVITGLYIGYFTYQQRRGEAARPALAGTPAQRAGLLALMALLFASIAVSHQLTPFVTLATLGALIVVGLGRQRTLLLLLTSLLLAHFAYLAHTYFAGHMTELLSFVGRLTDNLAFASEVLVDAGRPISSERAFVLVVRQSLTLLIAGLAVVGWGRRRRQGLTTWPAVVAGVVPATLVLLQPYGGEIFMRIYLFSLPFLAFFAAALLLPRPGERAGLARVFAVTAITGMMAAGNALAYYGNESMNFIAADETLVLEKLVQLAPGGALIVTQTDNAPIRQARYQELDYLPLPDLVAHAALDPTLSEPDQLAEAMGALTQGPVYLLLSRSQTGNARLFGVLPEVDWGAFTEALDASSRFRRVYRNDGGSIFALRRARFEPAP